MGYICKIASIDEMNIKWDCEIRNNEGDPDWLIWKDKAIKTAQNGQSIAYYGVLNGQIISEATAMFDADIVQNPQGLVDEKTVYLSAFRTIKQYQSRGYFSKLFYFMLNDLKQRGYERVTLGVEPCEITNMQIYFHYGFTEYVKTGKEFFPKGDSIDVIYYAKNI